MINKKLNILIVASWYKSESNLTYGSFIEEQARMLKRKGHNVTVLHPFLKGTFISSIRDRKMFFSFEKDNGLNIIRLGIAPPLPGIRSLSYNKLSIQTLNKIQTLFDKIGFPDIIHSHSLFMGGVIANFLSVKKKIPFVHTEHTSSLIFNFSIYSKTELSILQNVYRNAEKVLFVSSWFKNEMIKRYSLKPSNLAVLHNVVDPIFFERNLTLHTTKNLRFLIIGDFQIRKQHSLLLEAWKIVLNSNQNVSLTIAGNGERKKELINEAIQLDINKSINWIPRLNRLEVRDQIVNHDVILSCSQVETFGLTVAEAISLGKPVIVTDSGGVRDIVIKSNGIITEQTPQSFGHGILKLIENFDTYQSKLIRDNAYQNFSEEKIGTELESIYAKALNH